MSGKPASTVKELREKFDEMKKNVVMQDHLMAQLEYTTCWIPENGFHWDKNEPNGIKGIFVFCKYQSNNRPVRWMGYRLVDGTEGECRFPPYSDAVVFNKDPGYVYDKNKLDHNTAVKTRVSLQEKAEIYKNTDRQARQVSSRS